MHASTLLFAFWSRSNNPTFKMNWSWTSYYLRKCSSPSKVLARILSDSMNNPMLPFEDAGQHSVQGVFMIRNKEATGFQTVFHVLLNLRVQSAMQTQVAAMEGSRDDLGAIRCSKTVQHNLVWSSSPRNKFLSCYKTMIRLLTNGINISLISR